MLTMKNILSTVVQEKYPHSWSTTNLPFLYTEQLDLPRKVHTAQAVILALGSEEIPTAGRPESSAGAKDKLWSWLKKSTGQSVLQSVLYWYSFPVTI